MQNMVFELNKLGLLRVSGNEAEKFLQGQLSCDVSKLSPTAGTMGVHCNPQGRVISLFYATKTEDAYYLVMPRDLIPIAYKALEKYSRFFKAELNDASDSFIIAGTNYLLENSVASIQLPNSQRYLHLLSTPLPFSTDFNEWNYADMQEGLPSLHPSTSGKFLPHDLNLPALDAISFAKGCFTGQEIIARMHYRGKPKTHLYRGLCTKPLLPDTLIYLNSEPTRDVGSVIDCCEVMHDNYYALLFTANEACINQPLMTADKLLIKPISLESTKSELT